MAFVDLLSFLRTEYKPAPGEFLPINMPNLAAKLELRERGRERGAKGIPHSNAGTLDEVENEIAEAIRTHALDEERRTYEQLSLYEQRLQAADPYGAAAEMRATATQSVAQFEAEALAAKSELEHGYRKLLDARQALRAFRERNDLARPAAPPKNHVLMFGILFLLFLIETAPNAIMLGGGDELGVLGGYMIAIVYSFLNLSIGWGAGYFCWRNVGHRQHWRKALGLTASLLFFAVVAFLNLLVAHIRQEVGAGATTKEAALASWDAITTHPFALHDSMAMGLAAMGIVFSLIASFDGLFWEDPYPGYSSRARQAEDEERKWTKLVEERLTVLDEVQQRHANLLLAARGALRDRRAAIPDILAARSRLIRNFDLHIKHLQGIGRYALSAYRDANRGARDPNNPAPKHFDQEWTLTGITAPEQPPAPPISDKEWQAANDALETSMEKLQRAFQDAISWIASLSGPKAVEAVRIEKIRAA